MRVVIVSEWFSERMGYIENCLPKAMALLGHDVHVVTSNRQTYFNSPSYKVTYEPFIGPSVVECGVKRLDGFTLHRKPLIRFRGRLGIRGLIGTLRRLRPHVVQTLDMASLATYQSAIAKPIVGYQLFTANHVVKSVFPPARADIQHDAISRLRPVLSTWVPGRLVSLATRRCYPVTADAADIAIQFLGVQSQKVKTVSLGVDTEVFHPPRDEEESAARLAMRKRLGVAPDDIVCVYSGRFSKDKNPACLATAVARLFAEGRPYRGLFIGSGPQKDEIESTAGCIVHPFVSFDRLGAYFRSADVGVWPRQESTSMLDASASGLPIVISDRVEARERVDGRGLTYRENDAQDLAQTLLSLQDPERRFRLGMAGAEAIRARFSWMAMAQDRIRDYEESLADS